MTYTYQCQCGNVFDIQQSIHAQLKATCPTCNKITNTRLIPQSVNFILYGKDWPSQDLRRKENKCD